MFGLKKAIIRSKYPMQQDKKLMENLEQEANNLTDEDIKKRKNLGATAQGSGHDNFLKGIVVQFDIVYPNYFTPQLQRYNFVDIISSSSKMHRLIKMDLNEVCNEYTLYSTKKRLEKLINIYNKAIEVKAKEIYAYEVIVEEETIYTLDKNDTETEYYMEDSLRTFSVQDIYMMIISNCPMGLEQFMGISTNYLQLKTIYNQRKNHKLKDWHIFCDWIKTLPYFKELTGCED